MDLSEFIKTTLVSIKTGIVEANAQTDSTFDIQARPQVINFNVAVTISKARSGSGKGGLRIHVVEAELGAASKKEESNVSRIDFTIGVKKRIQ